MDVKIKDETVGSWIKAIKTNGYDVPETKKEWEELIVDYVNKELEVMFGPF